ncbi:MAG: ABC transporter ATP-binding protein [Candidatus Bathyarchaeia archaeon]
MGTILEVSGLRKYYGEVHAVDDVNFSVNVGEILSIIGPNGAGKTTLLNLIGGVLKPDKGQILFEGNDVTRSSLQKRVKMGIVKSFQLINLFENLSVLDCIMTALISKKNRTFSLFRLLDHDHVIKGEAEAILKTFNLYGEKEELVKNLPHGDKKLLDVASAFALGPKLLLLDEPTSGVSSSEKHGVMDVIRSAVKDKGCTAIVVEHDMDVVFSYSDRIVVMADGKIIAEGKPEEVKSDSRVIESVLGLRKI